MYARQITALEAERTDLKPGPSRMPTWSGVRPVRHSPPAGTAFNVAARNRLLRDLDARIVWGCGFLIANLYRLEDPCEALG